MKCGTNIEEENHIPNFLAINFTKKHKISVEICFSAGFCLFLAINVWETRGTFLLAKLECLF